MKTILMASAALLVIAFSAPQAEAIGCLGGAAAGAAAGHFVGKGHALLGGAAGCALGHAHKKNKERQMDNRSQDYRGQQYDRQDRRSNDDRSYNSGTYYDNRR